MKTKHILLFLSFWAVARFALAVPHPAPFVWIDESGTGRHTFVCFRYDIEINTLPQHAELNLFADSYYKLYVNGHFVNFGPSRFYPENPRFDTYKLEPWLKKGKNTIGVLVLSNGMNTYQLVKNIGGFAAWGEIEADGNTFALATPGQWKCRRCEAWDAQTPKFSFAQGAVEVYDARKEIHGWNLPDVDLTGWKTPVVLKNQQAWGPLRPRTIEPLRHREIIPRSLLGIYNLQNEEEIYSFSLLAPDATKEDMNEDNRAFAYTWIYSPVDQQVDAGTWWGEHYLNGEGPLKDNGKPESRNNRINRTLSLKKGWNYLFVKYDLVWAYWSFFLSLPRDAGLIVAADKRTDSDLVFMTAGPFAGKERKKIQALTLPLKSPDELPRLSQAWKPKFKTDVAINPAQQIAWSTLNGQIAHHPALVTDIQIDTGGVAVLFDLGGNTHGRPFIEFSAPEGTVFDIGWEEDLCDNRLNVLKRSGVNTAARYTAAGGEGRFETFRPYGHRYLQINIYNNTSPVMLKRAGTIEHVYPLDKRGSFRCSDAMLNAIWELGWRTIRICADDVYIDPFRERGLYAGDLLAQTTLAYVTSGDTRLMRQSLEQIQGLYREALRDFTDQPTDRHGIRILSDYPVISFVNLCWYGNLTGDWDFVRESYPAYKAMMDSLMLEKGADGVYEHKGAFIEWIPINRNGKLAAMHALMAEAYLRMSELAGRFGYTDDSSRYALVHSELVETLQTRFWSADKGAFFDGYLDGKPMDSFFPASSAWPSLYGYTTPSQEAALSKFYASALADIGNVSRQGTATPYGGMYILGALYRQGYVELAEFFMRKYWSEMILRGDDTAWENFFYSPHESKSHGWSGAPTYYLSTQVLGVQLGYPEPTDLSKVTIAPQAETIDYASGTVPHPTGDVTVDWRVSGDNLFLNCVVAPGVEYIVSPRGRLAHKTLWVNGVKR